GVPHGLALDGLVADQPPVGRPFGRHVRRRVHADVDVLALTGDVARQHRGQRAQRREHGARLIALVAATAYRWQRVVVVPTAPYRAATREDGEVCRLLGTAGVVAAERGERDPHDAGVCAE